MIPALNPVMKAMATILRMQQCRETAKAFAGASYAVKIEPVKKEILDRAAAKGIEYMPAALELMKEKSSAGNIMWISAAALEISEDNNRQPPTK